MLRNDNAQTGCYIILSEIFLQHFVFSSRCFFFGETFSSRYFPRVTFIFQRFLPMFEFKRYFPSLEWNARQLEQESLLNIFVGEIRSMWNVFSSLWEFPVRHNRIIKWITCFPMSAVMDIQGRKSITESWLRLICTSLFSNALEGIIR